MLLVSTASRLLLGFPCLVGNRSQAYKGNPWDSLNPALSLEQPLHKRITGTGRGKCSVSWSSLPSRTQLTQTGGHHGQGTTGERVFTLPTPAAETRRPEGKKSCSTGSSGCGVKHWKYQHSDAEENWLLSLSKQMRGFKRRDWLPFSSQSRLGQALPGTSQHVGDAFVLC